MAIKITMKRKLIINGKEYGSSEEMPENIRKAFEKTMNSSGSSGLQEGLTKEGIKIVFNNVKYKDIDEMPPDIRQVYESVINAAKTADGTDELSTEIKSNSYSMDLSGDTIRVPDASYKPIEPDKRSLSLRTIAALTVIIIVLLIYFLVRTAG